MFYRQRLQWAAGRVSKTPINEGEWMRTDIAMIDIHLEFNSWRISYLSSQDAVNDILVQDGPLARDLCTLLLVGRHTLEHRREGEPEPVYRRVASILGEWVRTIYEC